MVRCRKKSLTDHPWGGDNVRCPVAPAGLAVTALASPPVYPRLVSRVRMNRILATALVTLLFSSLSIEAATRRKRQGVARPAAAARSTRKTRLVRTTTVMPARPAITKALAPAKKQPLIAAPFVRGGPWTEPTYADSTAGDFVDGEDLTIRRAAVEAL